MMSADSAILLMLAEQRQAIAALQAENQQLRNGAASVTPCEREHVGPPEQPGTSSASGQT